MVHSRQNVPVITCEHAGREVPPAYAALFAGRQALLDTHRGWDPGAIELGRQLADAFGVTLHATTTTRLLVEPNRSIGNRELFSEFTRPLPRAQRQEIVERHYRPHRDAVEAEVARHIAAGRRVVHVASHSFTPVLDGKVRNADVTWLYDPRRRGEAEFACDWQRTLAALAPDLRLRRNYPYRGRDDGLSSWLRKRHPDDQYLGLELEVNQRFFEQGGAPWERLRAVVVESLLRALADSPGLTQA